MNETIFIASDHAGVDAKTFLIHLCKEKKINIQDLGPQTKDSVDYPDFAKNVCTQVLKNKNALGILICGTGIGMSIAANKIKGIRAALVTTPWMAQMSRNHNDANVLCLGARNSTNEILADIVNAWLEFSFEGDRHQKRIDKINQLENS